MRLFDKQSLKFTTRYCAPELIDEPQVAHNFQSDIWALGCLVYEVLSRVYRRSSADRYPKLLTDILPYSTARSESNIMMCMMRGNLPAILPSPVLPRDVSGLLASCWEKPLQRPGALDFVRKFQVSQQLQQQMRSQPPNLTQERFFQQQSAQVSRVIDLASIG